MSERSGGAADDAMTDEIALTIRVRYSCPECNLYRAQCDVRARGVGEDVLDWMAETIKALSVDHARRSPNCHPRELRDVLIPAAGTDRIGGPTVQ